MSNRNFDASVMTQRLRDQNIAHQRFQAQCAGKPFISNPQTSSAAAVDITSYQAGTETTYSKNMGTGYTVSTGGVADLLQ
jgi:hypothetical protein